MRNTELFGIFPFVVVNTYPIHATNVAAATSSQRMAAVNVSRVDTQSVSWMEEDVMLEFELACTIYGLTLRSLIVALRSLPDITDCEAFKQFCVVWEKTAGDMATAKLTRDQVMEFSEAISVMLSGCEAELVVRANQGLLEELARMADEARSNNRI